MKRPKDHQNLSRGCRKRSNIVNPWRWRPSWTPFWILQNAQWLTQFTRQIVFIWCLKFQNQVRKKLYQTGQGMLTWLPVYGSHLNTRRSFRIWGFPHQALLETRDISLWCEDVPLYIIIRHVAMEVLFLNPLRAKFLRENINIYLHFMSFLHTSKT